MEYKLLSENEVKKVIANTCDTSFLNPDQCYCCSIADILDIIEYFKKHGEFEKIKEIREYMGKNIYYSNLLMACLESYNLDKVIFSFDSYIEDINLWAPINNTSSSPKHSLHLAVIKAFDLNMDSDLLSEIE